MEKIVESLEQLKAKRDSLCFKTGQHQFNKAIIEAELLQFNQELLSLSQEIQKRESPIKAAPNPPTESEIVTQ